ncbi:Mannosylglycerate hydrolase [Planctomycetes bacterium Pla163]|uniref:Mannosylglycerate hydrolase n=1 Tax=Rohdeia mirabilis TaxID=2528008 RepID=A0A518D1R1_9BACT|nr:Mannosylglycerate hydrolase [Planctomycetes bacterium Pla163]
MVTDAERTRQRTEVFVAQVLDPAIFADRLPLAVAAWQPEERVDAEAARVAGLRGDHGDHEHLDGAFADVELGWRFGPVWSSCWFRLRAHLPERFAGSTVHLRFDCGTEATLWRNGVPVHGFDPNRDLAPLGSFGHAGSAIDLYVEAHCNHPLGVATFWWDAPETHSRWSERRPGRLEKAELVRVDETVRELATTLRFAAGLVAELGDASPRANRLRRAIERARTVLDPAAPGERAFTAIAIVREALGRGAQPSATLCYAIGHAHLDTAWLWTTARTREKSLRTWANALELMERDGDFRFLASQPQQLAWLEDDSPELFARVSERIAQGRVELHAATWVEPDGHLPSGESMCRQLAFGSLWLRSRFGEVADQRMLYLPDTFGFCAAWPQLARLAGLDTFVTNKLWWSEREDFPYSHFTWRGLDGSELRAHVTPGQDYNATNTPLELRRGERVLAERDRVDVGIWLQPFGHGDGGGGPTQEQIWRARCSQDAEGLPQVRFDGAHAFARDFHERADELADEGTPLPVIDGELSIENHRGTYTTHSALKRGNARAEQWLRGLEAAVATWPLGLDADARERLGTSLRADWSTVLLLQFHDILPGSCTADVAREARADHERLDAGWLRLAGALAERLASRFDASDENTAACERPTLAVNLSSVPRSGWFGEPARGVWATDVPAFGYRLVDAAAALPEHVARPLADFAADGAPRLAIEVDGVRTRVELSPDGAIRSLVRGEGDEFVAPDRALGELVLHDDRPLQWEAWNVDSESLAVAQPVVGDEPVQWRAVDLGPASVGFECERPCGARSHVVTRVWLEAGDPAVHLRYEIDWREERRWLRALFPALVRARTADCEVPFGHLARPLTANDATERMAFEVPIQRFVDVAEPGRGLSVVNDTRYGASLEVLARGGSQIGVSLLRSASWPDATADRTEARAGRRHRVHFQLVPHHGDWREAGVLARAETAPLGWTAVPLAGLERTARGASASDSAAAFAPTTFAPLRCTTVRGAARVQIAAVAPSWDGSAVVVRLVERAGARGRVRVDWNVDVESVAAVDLLERPRPRERVEHTARATEVELRPFQVVTLRVEL